MGLLLLVATGCRAGDVAGNLVGGLFGGGRVSDVTRAAVGGAVDSAQQQWTKFSPEQEYYLGRAVAAEAIATYGLDPQDQVFGPFPGVLQPAGERLVLRAQPPFFTADVVAPIEIEPSPGE